MYVCSTQKQSKMPISLKELELKVKKEQATLKRNQKTIDINNKAIASIIDKAHTLNIDDVNKWIEEIKEWEQISLNIRTIKAYAQFHNGRISAFNLVQSLLNTIKNKQLKK